MPALTREEALRLAPSALALRLDDTRSADPELTLIAERLTDEGAARAFFEALPEQNCALLPGTSDLPAHVRRAFGTVALRRPELIPYWLMDPSPAALVAEVDWAPARPEALAAALDSLSSSPLLLLQIVDVIPPAVLATVAPKSARARQALALAADPSAETPDLDARLGALFRSTLEAADTNQHANPASGIIALFSTVPARFVDRAEQVVLALDLDAQASMHRDFLWASRAAGGTAGAGVE